jgi:hypothetical protein
MALVTKLKRRGHWPGIADPYRSAFADVESNAADAIDQLEQRKRSAWNRVVSNTPSVQASLWDLVICQVNCEVLIPAASVQNFGAEICVQCGSSLTVTIRPLSGTINGSASYAAAPSDRARVFVSTGLGWSSYA